MKKLPLFWILLFLSPVCDGQFFVNDYFVSNDSGAYSKISSCKNNLLLTASLSNTDSVLSIITTDETGNIIYIKRHQMPLNGHLADIATLYDSTVALLIKPGNNDAGYLLKVDYSCSVLWGKNIQLPNVASSFSFSNCAAFDSDGGAILSGTGSDVKNAIVRFDTYGNIIQQYSFDDSTGYVFENIDVTNIKPDKVVALSNVITSVNSIVGYYVIDSSGYVNHVSLLINFQNFFNNITGVKYLKASTDGGFYFVVKANGNQFNNQFVLVCFDANEQLVWAKRIRVSDYYSFIASLNVTSDGCILALEEQFLNYNSLQLPLARVPSLLKFDPNGTLEWMQTIGDTNTVAWRTPTLVDFEIKDDFLYGLLNREHNGTLSIFRTDYSLNALCYTSTTFLPVLTNAYSSITNYKPNYINLNFTTQSFQPAIISDVLNKQQLCVSTGIELLQHKKINIFPNPSNGKITITAEFYENTTLEIYNSNGIMIYQTILSSPLQQIDLSNLSAGFYFAKAIDSKQQEVFKLQVVK